MIYKNLGFILGYKVVKVQLYMGLLCMLVTLLLTKNYKDTMSALVGISLVVIPTILYVLVAFAKGVIAYPSVALKRHQKAMVLRFVVNFILFTLVLTLYKQCNYFVLFITYLVTLSAYWFILIRQ